MGYQVRSVRLEGAQRTFSEESRGIR
jgi:hypothetical protein